MTTPQRPWAERFDEEFGATRWKDKWVYRDGGLIHIQGIKAFIAAEIQDAVGRERARLFEALGKARDQGLDWKEALAKVFLSPTND